MTNITLQKQRRVLWYFIPGLALSAVITEVALWDDSIPVAAGARFSALTLAVLLGMVLGNTIYPHVWRSRDGGMLFIKQYLLRLGIILYGFRLTLSRIADVSISGIVIGVLTLSSTFLLACFLGQKAFGLDGRTSWLIGTSSSIRSAAAVLATEPVVKAEASKVTAVVATVVIFGIITIFLYPAICPLMSQRLSPETLGVYISSIVHEMAQVAVAGRAINPDAENVAVISKMLRMTTLAPLFILLAARVKQPFGASSGEKSKTTTLWSAILFIVVAVFNSLHLLPQSVVNMLITLDTFSLAMVVAALDLTTRVSALKKAGAEPLLIALVLFILPIVDGDAINYVIQSIIA